MHKLEVVWGSRRLDPPGIELLCVRARATSGTHHCICSRLQVCSGGNGGAQRVHRFTHTHHTWSSSCFGIQSRHEASCGDPVATIRQCANVLHMHKCIAVLTVDCTEDGAKIVFFNAQACQVNRRDCGAFNPLNKTEHKKTEFDCEIHLTFAVRQQNSKLKTHCSRQCKLNCSNFNFHRSEIRSHRWAGDLHSTANQPPLYILFRSYDWNGVFKHEEPSRSLECKMETFHPHTATTLRSTVLCRAVRNAKES